MVKENIKQFFGSYFHQDWSAMYENYAEAIQAFANESSLTNIEEVIAFAEDVIRRGIDNEFNFREYGANFTLSGSGISNHTFFSDLLSILRKKKSEIIIIAEDEISARKFFEEYFNDTDFQNWDEVIREFGTRARLTQVKGVLEFANRILVNGKSDEFNLGNYGIHWQPSNDGITNKEFLTGLVDILEEQLAQRSNLQSY